MARTPTDILEDILAGATDIERLRSLVAADASYVSLNFADPELKKVMPWAGTGSGPEGIAQTFLDVRRFWEKHDLEKIALFGDDRYAAMFGRMSYRSTVMGQDVISPFCIYIEVVDGLCRHMQFMEDTFATARSFRSGGEWIVRSDPDGGEVRV